MRVSFAPLDDDARLTLTVATGVDFTEADMRRWFCVTCRDNQGRVMGVLACEPKQWFDFHFSIALPDPGCLSPKLGRVVFGTLFRQASRITAHIAPDNAHAIEQAEKLGFRYEGFIRRGLDGRRDALLYGMLPEECVWTLSQPDYAALRHQMQGAHHGLDT